MVAFTKTITDKYIDELKINNKDDYANMSHNKQRWYHHKALMYALCNIDIIYLLDCNNNFKSYSGKLLLYNLDFEEALNIFYMFFMNCENKKFIKEVKTVEVYKLTIIINRNAANRLNERLDFLEG